MSVVQAVKRSRARTPRTRTPRARPSRSGSVNIAREVALHIASFISGAVISVGATLGDLNPFGASLVAAIPFTYMPAGMLGAALSYLFSSPLGSFRYIAVVISIGALR